MKDNYIVLRKHLLMDAFFVVKDNVKGIDGLNDYLEECDHTDEVRVIKGHYVELQRKEADVPPSIAKKNLMKDHNDPIDKQTPK